MRFILAIAIGVCGLTAATHQEISREDFSRIVLGESESRFESDLIKAFPSKPKYGYTTEFANLIKEFIDFSRGRNAIWDIEKIATSLQTVNPQHYKQFKESVDKVMHDPQYLTAQGAVEFQIALAFNAFILENREAKLKLEEYKERFIKSPNFSSLKERLTPGSFQGIVLSSRPKGALSTRHITTVLAAMAKFSSAAEYCKFTDTLLELPHYDSYHYLMAVEALANIPAEHFTKDFVEIFTQYAKTYQANRVPYGLMMAKDFNFDKNLMDQLISYQNSLK